MRMHAAIGIRGRVSARAGVVGLVAVLTMSMIGGVSTVRAQQAPGVDEVLYDMADSLGMLRTNAETDMFMSVEIWASGSIAEVTTDAVGSGMPASPVPIPTAAFP